MLPRGACRGSPTAAKKTTPLPALLGVVVHDAMDRCVSACVAGASLPTVAELRRIASDALNAAWRSSRRHLALFLKHPSRVAAPMLQEFFYDAEPTTEALERYREKLDRVVRNLHSCEDLWAATREAAPGDVIRVGRFHRFPLVVSTPDDIVPVYAAPDLVVRRRRDEPFVITDLKSGDADGVVDQVLTYAVALRDGMRVAADEGFVGQVVALDASDDRRVTQFGITPAEIDAARQRLVDNVLALRRLLVDAVANVPRPVGDFPRTRDPWTCRRCAHRVHCWPELYPIRRPNERTSTARSGRRDHPV